MLAALFAIVGEADTGVEEPSLAGVLALLFAFFLERGVYLYPGYRFYQQWTGQTRSGVGRIIGGEGKARLLTMCSSFSLRASARNISFFSSGRSSHSVPTITLTSARTQKPMPTNDDQQSDRRHDRIEIAIAAGFTGFRKCMGSYGRITIEFKPRDANAEKRSKPASAGEGTRENRSVSKSSNKRDKREKR